MRFKRLIFAVTCTGLLWVCLFMGPAQAEDNHWGFGSDHGLTTGTVDGTVFNLGFNIDYYLDRNFSFGPMMQITSTGDLFHISFAGVGKYNLRFTNGINLVPFTGIGLIHTSLDRGMSASRGCTCARRYGQDGGSLKGRGWLQS